LKKARALQFGGRSQLFSRLLAAHLGEASINFWRPLSIAPRLAISACVNREGEDELVSRPPGNAFLLPGKQAPVTAGGLKRSAAARCAAAARRVKLFSGSIQLRARFTGRLGARFTRSRIIPSRKEIYVWITSTGKASGQSVGPASGNSGTIHATGKCTRRCSKARDTRKSIFSPDRVEGEIPAAESLYVNVQDFWFYMQRTPTDRARPSGTCGRSWTQRQVHVPFIDWASKRIRANFFLKVDQQYKSN